MPPNIVFLSLDGVSQTMFWQYRETMPFLWELSLRSAMFRRFFTSETSAFASFCACAHGDAGELDHNPEYPTASGCLAGRTTNLFAVLRDRGFATLGIQHGSLCPPYTAANFYGAWPEGCGDFQHHADYARFDAAIADFLAQRRADAKPFALYVSDRAARPDDSSPEKNASPLYHERFAKGFSLLDRTAAATMGALASSGLLANTIVAAFGPYGMDPWKHGINRGRVNTGVPHADTCWTPLFIYNNGNDICTADQLVSSIDLKPTVLHMLFPEERQPEARGPLSGVDILRYRRQTALTQSLFALERENEGSARGMARSYAASDGDQRLIVTSDGGIAGEGGMELYFDARDPGNTRNFLDFFDLDDNGVMTSFGRKDIVHVHFTQSFRQNLVMSIVNSYNTMREQLHSFIRAKEREAAALLGGTAEGMRPFPDEAFKRKRKWI